MSDPSAVNAAVLPLEGAIDARSSSDALDPWRALAANTGVLVSWDPAPTSGARPRWGRVLAPTSSFAQQLTRIMEHASSHSLANVGEQLFRVELPAGQTFQNLVPAIGGGFRGMTRAAGSKSIMRHARLIPIPGAAAGATAIALGPLVGVMALTVGTEMLARHQLDEKLDAIHRGVEGITQHLQQQLTATLATAEAALQDATTALLDNIEVPEAVGLGSAVTELRTVKNQAVAWLTQWERVADTFAQRTGPVDLDDFRNDLGNAAIGGWDAMPANMVLLYRALALDSRAHVVSIAQATLHRPSSTFEHFEAQISERLAANADAQRRLTDLLWALATTTLGTGLSTIRPRNWRQLGATHTVVTQLTRALTAAPDAPALITADNRLLLEAIRQPDGRLELLEPQAA